MDTKKILKNCLINPRPIFAIGIIISTFFYMFTLSHKNKKLNISTIIKNIF